MSISLSLGRQANEEQWKRWKQESRTKRQGQNREVDESQAPAASANTNDIVVINDSDDADEAPSATPSQALIAVASVPAPVVNRTGRGGADKMFIQRALRAATARAALARFDVAAQTADVVSAFQQVDETEQHKKARVAGSDQDGDDDDTDTDDEAVEPTTTVYCDTCNKARILSADEAEAADVGADTWTCAKVLGLWAAGLGLSTLLVCSHDSTCVCVAQLVDAQRDGGCDAVDDEVEQIAGKTIALLLQKAHIHTRKQLANATASKALKLLVTPAETAYSTLKDRLTNMIEEVRWFTLLREDVGPVSSSLSFVTRGICAD